MFINLDARKLLHDHCQELSDLSKDLASWRSSPYQFTHFCDFETLSELRRHWLLYATACSDSDINETLVSSMRSWMADEYIRAQRPVLSNVLRSTGIALSEALSLREILGEFDKFWINGTTYSDDTSIASAQFANPTFAYSLAGSRLVVHYATHPLVGFHLAPVYVPLEESHRKKATKPTFGDLVGFARAEFARWGCALRRLVSSDNVSINFFCGDAANFSTSLQGYLEDLWGMSRWTLNSIHLMRRSVGQNCSASLIHPTLLITLDC